MRMNNNASLQKPTWCGPLLAQTLSDLLISHIWLLWKGKYRVEDTSWWLFPTCEKWTVVPRGPSWGQRPDSSHDAPEVREMLWTCKCSREHLPVQSKVNLIKITPAVLCLKHTKPQPWQAARAGSSKGWFIKFLDWLLVKLWSSEQCWQWWWAWGQHCCTAITTSGQPCSLVRNEKEQSSRCKPTPKNVGLTLGWLRFGGMSSSRQVSSLGLRNLSTWKQTTAMSSLCFAFLRASAAISQLRQLCDTAICLVRMAFSFCLSCLSSFLCSPEGPEQV